MSKRIEDSLKVLELIRDSYRKNSSSPIDLLRNNAIDKIAKRGVDPKTVFAHLVGKNVPSKLPTDKFDRLVKSWLEEGSFDLKEWYLLDADYSDRRRLEAFFNTPPSPKLNIPEVVNLNEPKQRDQNLGQEINRIVLSANPIKDLEEYKQSYENLLETEREAIIQSRIGQGKFRSNLIKYWESCAITNCRVVELLKASHIKPWRESSNIERLDIYNGLLIIPNLDSAFDNGLISFENYGKIIISKFLSNEDRIKLGLNSEMKVRKLEEQHIKYLEYHRKNIFRGG